MKSSNPKFKGKYRIASNRLEGWDYRSPGYYFITICTHDHIIRNERSLENIRLFIFGNTARWAKDDYFPRP